MRVYTRGLAVFMIAFLLPAAASADDLDVGWSAANTVSVSHMQAYWIVLRDRGKAFAEKGDWDHAIADFNEAIRLNPKDAEAFSGRAAAYEAKGDLVRAAADRDSALHLKQYIPIQVPH